MNEESSEKIREILRRAIPPVADRELKRDLWPQMLRRLEEPSVQVPWFDWALVGLVAMWFLFYPGALPLVLYHL